MTTGHVHAAASHSWQSVDAVNRIPLLLLLLAAPRTMDFISLILERRGTVLGRRSGCVRACASVPIQTRL